MHGTPELESGQCWAGLSAASALTWVFVQEVHRSCWWCATVPQGPCFGNPENCGMQLHDGIRSVQPALSVVLKAFLSGGGQKRCGTCRTGGQQGYLKPLLVCLDQDAQHICDVQIATLGASQRWGL